MSPIQGTADLRLTQVSLVVTAVATALLAWSTGHVAWMAAEEGQIGRLFEAILFGALAGFLVYGNLCYQVARLGQLTRIRAHQSSRMDSPMPFARESAPALTVLVPSYKEEIPVIRQTLLSAALQDYPNKRVVLLLDDPPNPKTPQERKALWAGRTLPFELQTLLKEPAEYVAQAQAAFLDRRAAAIQNFADECVRLSDCFSWVSAWFETQAKHSPEESHTDVWFVEQVLNQPAEACREQATLWFSRRTQIDTLSTDRILDEIDAAYAHIAGRFQVKFDVFERKQYRNLSQVSNKAMNLNSYLGLMGTRVKPVLLTDGVHLIETSVLTGSRVIPNTPYVITLDADSLLLQQYASTLVRLMEQPEHARMAVAQTPYSAIPNAPGAMERTAGATTDIQYLVHQGFTQFGATFWVGANALLRKSALEEICIEERESTGLVRRYIQDRTVIEDTESTVDLLSKGWSLYNYPERLAYSATPPDFGSLIVQRARWANGGLIIFPKLLSYLRRTPKQLGTIAQGLLQIHYLTSLAFAPLSVLLLLVIPFSSDVMTAWMPLAALPFFALYARDLALNGYKPMRDLLRVYALNLLLIPVHLGGALKSMQQAILGTKIPFRRTPKISGRTRTPALYLALELAMMLLSTGLALYYASQLRWISGAFALANAALLLYGIKHFIGFAELKQDLLLSAEEMVDGQALRRARARLSEWVALVDSLRTAALQTALRYSARQAIWSVLIAVEILTPALAAGTMPARNLIQLENTRLGTTDWIFTKPANRGAIEAIQNRLPEEQESLDGMEIAITVDDLPAHGEIPPDMNRRDIGKGVLRALESVHTPPVYGFSNAQQLTWAPDSLEVLKDWLQSGHLLGNHTFSHVNLALSTADAFIADIVAMDGLLTFLSPTGSPPKVFRYPYMNEGDTLEKHDRVGNFLENNGYQVAHITIHYDDWAWNNAYVRCQAMNDKAKMQWLQQHVVAAARREVRQAQKAAELVAGRDVRHILLVHLTAFNALTLAEVLAALQADGVKFIDLPRAMNDPIYRLNPGPSLSAGPTFLKQLIDAKNLGYPTGQKLYPLERIEAMCKP